MMIKYLANNVKVDLDTARMIRDWGQGDARVELWATSGGNVVWLETNGDPVVAQEDVRALLVECGLSDAAARQVSEGNVKAALDITYAVYPAQGTSEERRLRDQRFATQALAMAEAEVAARETQQPVIVEEHVRGGEMLESWEVLP